MEGANDRDRDRMRYTTIEWVNWMWLPTTSRCACVSALHALNPLARCAFVSSFVHPFEQRRQMYSILYCVCDMHFCAVIFLNAYIRCADRFWPVFFCFAAIASAHRHAMDVDHIFGIGQKSLLSEWINVKMVHAFPDFVETTAEKPKKTSNKH